LTQPPPQSQRQGDPDSGGTRLRLAPQGVVRYAAPTQGSQRVLGLDLLQGGKGGDWRGVLGGREGEGAGDEQPPSASHPIKNPSPTPSTPTPRPHDPSTPRPHIPNPHNPPHTTSPNPNPNPQPTTSDAVRRPAVLEGIRRKQMTVQVGG